MQLNEGIAMHSVMERQGRRGSVLEDRRKGRTRGRIMVCPGRGAD
jgi:hypothetical protein